MSFFLVFVASILGSPHCAAMCGGFVAIASQSQRPIRGQIAYHLGRLCTYLALGAIAGIIGKGLNQAGTSAGITQTATLITGILLIVSGVSMLLGRSMHLHSRFPFNRIFALHETVVSKCAKRPYFPFLLGLFSTLLPCGWLYSYVIVAGGTGQPLSSVLIMAAFWLGTLPLLITIGSLSRLLSNPLKKFAPTIAALLIIAAGVYSLRAHLTHSHADHAGHGNMHEEHSMEHHHQ
ncbi:MAG: sulfite exporter TauE/SafE family protein [Deltaproteobacteria bacterium]|nr:sulfite exporter TauE/SafE family protein [Deltaproteobacteria bacterium]